MKRYAAIVGCPEKYLYLSGTDYRDADSYVIHKFRDVQVRHVDNSLQTIQAADQVGACQRFIDHLFNPAESGSLTVINGFPSLHETYLLFWHFVCHFASVKFSNAIKYKDFALDFIGNFRLEQVPYHGVKKHVLAFGPAVDEMNTFHVTTYIETMLRFDDMHKVLLTSTSDITTLLERLRVTPKEVKFLFNLSERVEEPKKMSGGVRKKPLKHKKLIENL